MGSRPFSAELPPVLQLRGYQQRWIDDRSRFKGAVKSARIGFSFGTGVESILDCLEGPNRTWTVLSASKPQSNEFVTLAQQNVQAIGATAELYEDFFADEVGRSEFLQSIIRFSNGSRIIALAANPRTARGYPGNAILDEFSHHENSNAIFAAIARQVALGHKLRVLSTPNGEQGKFYDLAKEFDLISGIAPATNPIRVRDWSWHWVDVHMAIAEGCPIDLQAMRDLFKDEELFAQEFLCVFLKAKGAWLPLELITAAEDGEAWIDWPEGYAARGELNGGIDVARDHDATELWLVERIGKLQITRAIVTRHGMPFPQQDRELAPFVAMTRRTAIDSTGMGIALYDLLNESCPGRVIGINFAGNNEQGVRMKIDLAIRLKKEMEKGVLRIPYSPDIRQQFQAVKRESTASGVRFEAPRIEVDTGVSGGPHVKRYAHADKFWAASLALFAADHGVISTEFTASAQQQAHAQMAGYC